MNEHKFPDSISDGPDNPRPMPRRVKFALRGKTWHLARSSTGIVFTQKGSRIHLTTFLKRSGALSAHFTNQEIGRIKHLLDWPAFLSKVDVGPRFNIAAFAEGVTLPPEDAIYISIPLFARNSDTLFDRVGKFGVVRDDAWKSVQFLGLDSLKDSNQLFYLAVKILSGKIRITGLLIFIPSHFQLFISRESIERISGIDYSTFPLEGVAAPNFDAWRTDKDIRQLVAILCIGLRMGLNIPLLKEIIDRPIDDESMVDAEVFRKTLIPWLIPPGGDASLLETELRAESNSKKTKKE